MLIVHTMPRNVMHAACSTFDVFCARGSQRCSSCTASHVAHTACFDFLRVVFHVVGKAALQAKLDAVSESKLMAERDNTKNVRAKTSW